MYNILIVDDEPAVCEGIYTILRNSSIPLKDIFWAYDGFEALDYLRLEKVNLLITDIQMESMGGIELMEAIFLENNPIPIIVLSAHGEFEYAQMAMKFGARQYIVKPVIPEQLIDIVRNELESKQRDFTSMDRELNEKLHFDVTLRKRDLLLYELVSSAMSASEIEHLQTVLGFQLDGPHFCVFLIQLQLEKGGRTDSAIVSLRDRNLLKYACYNVVEETLEKWNRLLFFSPNDTMSVVLQLSEEEFKIAHNSQSLVKIGIQINTNLEKYIHIGNTIGISTIRRGLPKLSTLYKEAQDVLHLAKEHADHYVFLAEDLLGRKPAQNRKSEVQLAKEYIDDHYRVKGLKLQHIASASFVSPNYMSYLFKKELGMTVWDYLTQLRMEEAKRLRLNTNKRRYEIADEVGYASPEHFSKIFKKHYGYNLFETDK